MSETVKYLFEESRLPKQWYNLVADLPRPPPGAAPRHAAAGRARRISRRCSRWR